MINNISSRLPLVGFIPALDNFGDTFTVVEIAKRYMELGGEAIFFTYGKKYEQLVKDLGCKTINMDTEIPEEVSSEVKELQYKYHSENVPIEKIFIHFFSRHFHVNIKPIEREIKAFKRKKVELVLTPFDFFAKISTRAAGIPLVFLSSGVVTPPYFKSNLATFPDAYESIFTRYIPQSIKNRLTNKYALRCKWTIKGFNKLAKHFNVAPMNHFLDLFCGDYTLIADEISFLNLKPTSQFPLRNYVGPIIPDYLFQTQRKQTDAKIRKHIEKPGRSILLSLGSSGTKQMFLDILDALNKTKYNVIAVYSTILNEDEIPRLNNNILLTKFVPSIKYVNEQVDIAIIHGGRGTVYTAAYAGKPVIGIPMQFEQQCNLDILVRHGMAIRLSKKNFNKKQLMKALREIFHNYDTYLNQALTLKKRLPEPKGAENAAKRIIEIIQHNVT